MKNKTTNVLRLAKTVQQKVQKENLFNEWHNLLITFSGGQDSAFCLLVLYLLQNRPCMQNQWHGIPFCMQDSGSLVNGYTLLWCNHFWQRDSFFTMEHVSKLTFCKSYTTYLFAPVKKVLSEQSARNWRHKAVQRSSSFLRRTMYNYNDESIELYLNSVLIITRPLFFCITKARPKSFFEVPCAKPDNMKRGYLNRSLKKPEQIGGSLQFPPCLVTKPKLLLPVRPCVAKPKVMQKQSFCTHNSIVQDQSRACLQKRNIRTQASKTRPKQLCVQGHNKSDRAETILFNLIRGTGMNGISTLRWKHTFSYPFNSNHTFYPRLSDFFKEIRVISLDSLLFKSCRQKRTVGTNKLCSSKAVRTSLLEQGCLAKTKLCKNEVVQKLRFCNARLGTQVKAVINLGFTSQIMDTTMVRVTKRSFVGFAFTKNTVNSDQFELKLFSKNSHVKTFYYQLKYKDKTI